MLKVPRYDESSFDINIGSPYPTKSDNPYGPYVTKDEEMAMLDLPLTPMLVMLIQALMAVGILEVALPEV